MEQQATEVNLTDKYIGLPYEEKLLFLKAVRILEKGYPEILALVDKLEDRTKSQHERYLAEISRAEEALSLFEN